MPLRVMSGRAGEVLSDKALLKKLLARHVILVVSSGNLLDVRVP